MTIIVNVKKKMNNNRYFLKFIPFIFLFFLTPFLSSCGGPSAQELLIGEWLIKDYESVIILNANGTWLIKTDGAAAEETEKKEDIKKADPEEAKKEKEVKEEGKEPEKDEKPGEKSLGLWDIKDKTLMISVEVDVPELEWKKDDKFDFEIQELTPLLLKLKDKEGQERVWERIKEEKKEEGKEGGTKEAKPLVIEGDPLVINLVQKLQYGKERYLCIKIDYHFNNPQPEPSGEKEKKKEEKKEGEVAEPFKYQFIHPEIKDAVIMHLGELQYRDVRNYEKLKGLREGIEKRISPYFHGDLLGITITDAIITSSKDSIDQFLGQYAPEPAKPEGSKDEKGEKGGSEVKKSGH